MSTNTVLSSTNKLKATKFGALGIIAKGVETTRMKITTWLFGCGA